MDNEKLELRPTGRYGLGVYAAGVIEASEHVAVFDGPVFDGSNIKWERDLLLHAIQVGPTLFRDSEGLARYINHSCDPNCGVRDSNTIVAMRQIEAGEELTWDYATTEDNKWSMACECGSVRCRGRITGYRDLTPALRKEYRAYTAAWLTEKYGEPV